MVEAAINFNFPERNVYGQKEALQEDRRFMEKVTNSIQHKDGHYHIGLPFKEQKLLPDNREQALSCLVGLKKKMMKNPKFQENYKELMSKDMRNKFLRKRFKDKVVKFGIYPIAVYTTPKNQRRFVWCLAVQPPT